MNLASKFWGWLSVPEHLTPIEALCQSYRDYDLVPNPAPDRPPRHIIFKQIALTLWPKGNPKHFIWHPWAEKMNEYAHQHRYLGLVGCASSGKSDFGAIYAIIQWLVDFRNTMVLVTSTSLKDSRKRIWGSITSYYQHSEIALPGHPVDSMGIIRSDLGGDMYNDKCGIALIAGEKRKERDAVGKLIGLKNARVFLIADELPELSPAIIDAAYSNLSSNPFFQLIGIGNLVSAYTPLGEFVKPKEGWASVDQESEDWETETGWCVRFDGEKSPNVLEGKDVWPIYGNAKLREHRKTLKQDSLAYWRQCRSFIAPVGSDDTIYSEADLLAGHCYDAIKWMTTPIPIASFDPSYTQGGDRAIAYFGAIGLDVTGKRVIWLDKYVPLRENVMKKNVTRATQLAEQWRDMCLERGVKPEHAIMDVTAAGKVMWDVVAEKWSPKVVAGEFGGSPSELPCTISGQQTTCKEAYDRKVSEIWYSALELIRGGQIKGICYDLANEMKARKYTLIKGATMKISVESKKLMKDRLGYSPDIADAAFLLVDLCKQKFGIQAAATNFVRATNRDAFRQVALNKDKVYHKLYGTSV